MSDLHRAATLFAVSLAILIFGATLQLNSWPGTSLFPLVTQPSLHTCFIIFGGYSLLVSTLFWAGMPSVKAQRFVIACWPVTTFAWWIGLGGAESFVWAGDGLDAITLVANGMGVPTLAASIWRAWRPHPGADQELEANFRWLLIMFLLFILVPRAALDLTVSFHPKTYDFFALKFDAAAGWHMTPQIIDAVDAFPLTSGILKMAYGLTPLGFFALALLQLRRRAPHLPHALLLWVVMTVCALLAYHFFPITGPKYVFGSSEFLNKLRHVDLLPIELTAGVGPNPRNGMPSMHFGWMLGAWVVWIMSETRWWSKAILGLMTVCVIFATLYLGEHYVVDLIVAVPFVLGAVALATTNIPWSSRERWQTVVIGFSTWLAWVLLLRTHTAFLVENPWACWLMAGITAALAAIQSRNLSGFKHLVQETGAPAAIRSSPAVLDSRMTRRMGAMFFASGVAALVYQVLFAKELALVFGSTATATFTVLATFLGGMAIGSLIGGHVAARTTRPIVAYAFVELAIGLFCLATPALFSAIQSVYVFLAADITPGAPVLVALRIALGAGVLMVPTVLMGITLPLLAQAMNPKGDKLGLPVALLYACNTAGAAFGALLTSYMVIPLFGVRSTTLIAAALNLMVALAALELAKMFDIAVRQDGTLNADGGRDSVLTKDKQRALWGAWIALGVGGILSLGLEVVYVHLLSIVAGNSVYAFGLMLATFLVGLAIGGDWGRRIIARPDSDRAAWLATVQAGLAAAVALGAWGWDMIPEYFASFAGFPLVTSFESREAVRGMVCALVMVPPTIFIGASYTLAMDLAAGAAQGRGIKIIGISAALNTLGNIAGVLLFGFVLLPRLGGLVSSKVVAFGALAIAAVLAAYVCVGSARFRAGAALVVSLVLVLVSPVTLNYGMLSTGANVYFVPQNWGAVIDHSESIDGGLTMVTRREDGNNAVTTLLTNGKFQGNDAKEGEVQAQIGFAALPLLHQGRHDDALVIGYGTGATSRVFHDAGFKHIDIAELSRDMVQMADSHFSKINGKVSSAPGVLTHITDGRNLLLLTKRQYDVISIEITSIWFAGAASLYNRDFYQLARKKLRQDGVLQQWVQLHHMAPTDLLTIVGTLRSEFQYVSLYVVGGQGILIATNDASHARPLPQVLNALDSSSRLSEVRALAGRSFSDIAKELMLDPNQVDTLLDNIALDRSLWISTDNNLRLEYSTPKANATAIDHTLQANMKLLQAAREGGVGQLGLLSR